jgi:hypothetical protein
MGDFVFWQHGMISRGTWMRRTLNAQRCRIGVVAVLCGGPRAIRRTRDGCSMAANRRRRRRHNTVLCGGSTTRGTRRPGTKETTMEMATRLLKASFACEARCRYATTVSSVHVCSAYGVVQWNTQDGTNKGRFRITPMA